MSTSPDQTSTTPTVIEEGGLKGDVEKSGTAVGDVKPGPPSFPEGGLRGWMCVAGAWFILMVTFGYANAFGVYQSYYQLEGYPEQSASNISWVGSVQLFFQLSLGAVAGPLYDKGYFYYLIGFGTVLYIICLFMLSLTKQFWQVILAQALGIGISSGILYLPAVSVLSQYFFKRRAFAIGIAATGSSTGGLIFPIMLNRLIASQGFPSAVRGTGFVILGALVLSCALLKPRLPPNPNPPKKPSPKELFADRPYSIAVAALFFTSWGIFFPIFYLQVFALSHGTDENLAEYTLAILNAASVFGRTLPNLVADKLGSLNCLSFMCGLSGILVFAMFGATNNAGLIVFAILYGFTSGAYVSLLSPSLIGFAKNPSEIGLRIGMGFLVASLAGLSGTPITGALLDGYGYVAPIVFSGVCVCIGCVLLFVAGRLQGRVKGTWKV